MRWKQNLMENPTRRGHVTHPALVKSYSPTIILLGSQARSSPAGRHRHTDMCQSSETQRQLIYHCCCVDRNHTIQRTRLNYTPVRACVCVCVPIRCTLQKQSAAAQNSSSVKHHQAGAVMEEGSPEDVRAFLCHDARWGVQSVPASEPQQSGTAARPNVPQFHGHRLRKEHEMNSLGGVKTFKKMKPCEGARTRKQCVTLECQTSIARGSEANGAETYRKTQQSVWDSSASCRRTPKNVLLFMRAIETLTWRHLEPI